MEGLGKGTAVWKMGGPSGAEENESESGARQQSSLLTSLRREVKLALANSGRKFSPEEVVELREQFNSVSEFPQFFVCSNRVSSITFVCIRCLLADSVLLVSDVWRWAGFLTRNYVDLLT